MKTKYIIWTIILFVVEYYIGAYTHDAYVRPYLGDLLIGIFIYCLVRCFTNYDTLKTALAVLIYCYLVEVTQYFHLIVLLGLNDSLAAHLILGSQFSWIDMLCYTIGIGIVIGLERIKFNQKVTDVKICPVTESNNIKQ